MPHSGKIVQSEKEAVRWPFGKIGRVAGGSARIKKKSPTWGRWGREGKEQQQKEKPQLIKIGAGFLGPHFIDHQQHNELSAFGLGIVWHKQLQAIG